MLLRRIRSPRSIKSLFSEAYVVVRGALSQTATRKQASPPSLREGLAWVCGRRPISDWPTRRVVGALVCG